MNSFIETFAFLFDSILSVDIPFFITIVALTFQCIVCVAFLLSFNNASWKTAGYAFPAVLILSMWLVFSKRFLLTHETLSILVLILLSITFALTICEKHYVRAVFSACIFHIILITASSLSASLFTLFFPESSAAEQFIQDLMKALQIVLADIIVYVLSKLVLRFFHSDRSTDLKSGVITFGFIIISLLGLSATMQLPRISEFSTSVFPILLILLAFILSDIFLYVLVDQIHRIEQKKSELKLLEERIASEKAQYEETAMLWENARNLRHDMKQHFAIMLGQLAAGEISECESYLKEVASGIEASGRSFKTGIPTLDYILNAKLSHTENIDIVLMGAVDTLDDIERSDLASLFGNILDNALEALAKIDNTEYKHLEILFSMHNSQRIIICKNTVKESVLKTNPRLLSTKSGRSDKSGRSTHGIGHQIIERIAQKYHGTAVYFEENDMFGVQVQIPMP